MLKMRIMRIVIIDNTNRLFVFQAVPIPADLSMDAMETFIESAQTESFELAEIPKLSDLKQVRHTEQNHPQPTSKYMYNQIFTASSPLFSQKCSWHTSTW